MYAIVVQYENKDTARIYPFLPPYKVPESPLVIHIKVSEQHVFSDTNVCCFLGEEMYSCACVLFPRKLLLSIKEDEEVKRRRCR